MSVRRESSGKLRFLILILNVVTWMFLVPGILLMGRSAVEILGVQHVTANFLLWSSAGLLLMLIGLLTNSSQKELQLSPPNSVNSKG
jgi:uncharacterized membrane protein